MTLGFSRQPRVDRQRLAVRLQRLVWMASVAPEEPDAVVASGQVGLEFGDARVLAHEPFLDRQCLCVGFQRLVRMARVALEEPDVVVAHGEVTLELGDAGFVVRASRSRIASALPYDASACSGWPVADSILPRQFSIVAKPC